VVDHRVTTTVQQEYAVMPAVKSDLMSSPASSSPGAALVPRSVPLQDDDTRRQWIAENAYYRSLQREAIADPEQDWLEAEAAFDDERRTDN
jgi:hypothetical protein